MGFKKQIYEKKGGMFINTKDKNAFFEFITNSSIAKLTNGSNGITFIAKAKETYISKYSHLSTFNYNEPVRKLLIKLIFINNNEDNLLKINDGYNDINFRTTRSNEFKNEVNIQTDIFLKSMNYLQPICPAIVYANELTGADADNFLNLFKNSIPTQNSRSKYFIDVISSNFTSSIFDKIGVIGMEFADNYSIVASEVDSDKYELYKDMSLYLLLRLAIETGYTHGDFHLANIMINTDYKDYFKDIVGAPLLIDFGFTQKIPLQNLNIIKDNYNKKNYTEALKELCKIDRPDGLKMTDYERFYGWACGLYNFKTQSPTMDFEPNVNKMLGMLINKRELAINDVIKLFDEKHNSEPQKYPLLPLSNAVKNSMFEGLIGGKRKKKNYTRKNNKRGGKWSLKYKRSINCNRPKGFSQKQHCKYGRNK